IRSGHSLPTGRKMVQAVTQHGLQDAMRLGSGAMTGVYGTHTKSQYFLPHVADVGFAAPHGGGRQNRERQINQVKTTKDVLDRNIGKALYRGVDHVQDATVRAAGEERHPLILADHHQELVGEIVQQKVTIALDEEKAIAARERIHVLDIGQEIDLREYFRRLVDKLNSVGILREQFLVQAHIALQEPKHLDVALLGIPAQIDARLLVGA